MDDIKLSIFLLLAVSVGYVFNLIKIFLTEPLTVMWSLRLAGIIVWPVGALLGYIN